MTRLIIVTGLSGSGKSVALHTLEDEGFFCIDNLPSHLLSDLVDKLLASGSALYDKLAIGIDMRSERASADNLVKLLSELRTRKDTQVEVLFLDTDRSTLVTRFSETRRKHPLSSQELPLISAIDEEARLLDPVKADAELVVDTSALNLHELRAIIRTYVLGRTHGGLALIFQSFGFKHGTPASTDFMFDVRCLPNPHWEPELRAFTGLQTPIIRFLEEQADVGNMFADIRDFIQHWLPRFEAENRAYLTVSVGCTGGRHRSVYLVERLADHFAQARENVSRRHREL
ncbi:MAG: RNase adapter RapZ [Granulosicoccus sp.]|nr:RNase adapter RapZ [Granulosicoccus sp.]